MNMIVTHVQKCPIGEVDEMVYDLNRRVQNGELKSPSGSKCVAGLVSFDDVTMNIMFYDPTG